MTSINTNYFDEKTKATALARINLDRLITMLEGQEEAGLRFNDDEYVLNALQSNFTQVEFSADPAGTVGAALHDVAATDYWYSNEKRYEDSAPEVEDFDAEDE